MCSSWYGVWHSIIANSSVQDDECGMQICCRNYGAHPAIHVPRPFHPHQTCNSCTPDGRSGRHMSMGSQDISHKKQGAKIQDSLCCAIPPAGVYHSVWYSTWILSVHPSGTVSAAVVS